MKKALHVGPESDLCRLGLQTQRIAGLDQEFLGLGDPDGVVTGWPERLLGVAGTLDRRTNLRSWLGRYRRHSKDYERIVSSSEAMIHISMINLMSKRLAKPNS